MINFYNIIIIHNGSIVNWNFNLLFSYCTSKANYEEVFKIIGVKNAIAEVIRISDSNKNSHFFFGYYDVPGFNQDDTYHLCNHVGFKGRLPIAGEINEIGVINLKKQSFFAICDNRMEFSTRLVVTMV